MSLKTFFPYHLEFFPPNCGTVSDEEGKRLHEDISMMKQIIVTGMNQNFRITAGLNVGTFQR